MNFKKFKYVPVHYIRYYCRIDIFNNNFRYYGRDVRKIHFDLTIYNGKKKFKTYKNKRMSDWTNLKWNNIEINNTTLYTTKKIKLKNIENFNKNIKIKITNVKYGKKTYEEFYKTFSYDKESNDGTLIQFPPID